MSQNTSQPQNIAFQRVLVAVDNSEPAQRALSVAVRLSKCLQARCAVVHIVDLSPITSPELIGSLAIERSTVLENGEVTLSSICDGIDADLVVQRFLREGDPAQQIVALAREIDADIIVLGTHARGRLARLLLGSTAETVLRTATCPVLTVGHGPERACEPAIKAQGLEEFERESTLVVEA